MIVLECVPISISSIQGKQKNICESSQTTDTLADMIGERSPSTILMAISKDVIALSLCCSIWCTCSRVMIIDSFINKLLSNRNVFQPFSADLLWSLTGNFKVTFSSGWVQDSPWHYIIFQPNPPSGKLNLIPSPHGKKHEEEINPKSK